MSITIDDIDGFYLVPNVFNDEENYYFVDKIKNNKNINPCVQIHIANEFGWKFLPIKKKLD